MSSSNQIRDLEQLIRRGVSPERGRQGFKKALEEMRDRKSVEEKLDRYTQKLSQVLNDFDLNQLFHRESGLKFVADIKKLASDFNAQILYSRYEISIDDVARREKINNQLNKLLKTIEVIVDILNFVKHHLMPDHIDGVKLYMRSIYDGAVSLQKKIVPELCDSNCSRLTFVDTQTALDHSDKILTAMGMSAEARILDWWSAANSIKQLVQKFLNIGNQDEWPAHNRSTDDTTKKMFVDFFKQINQTLTRINLSSDLTELRQQKSLLSNLQLLLDSSMNAYQHLFPRVDIKICGLIEPLMNHAKLRLCELIDEIENRLPLAEIYQNYMGPSAILTSTIDILTETLKGERQKSFSANKFFSFFRKNSEIENSEIESESLSAVEIHSQEQLLARLTDLKKYTDSGIPTDKEAMRHLQGFIEDTLKHCSSKPYIKDSLSQFQQAITEIADRYGCNEVSSITCRQFA